MRHNIMHGIESILSLLIFNSSIVQYHWKVGQCDWLSVCRGLTISLQRHKDCSSLTWNTEKSSSSVIWVLEHNEMAVINKTISLAMSVRSSQPSQQWSNGTVVVLWKQRNPGRLFVSALGNRWCWCCVLSVMLLCNESLQLILLSIFM